MDDPRQTHEGDGRMIVIEIVTINNTAYQRTYSNTNYFIEREEHLFEEAIDSLPNDRIYTETDMLIPVPESNITTIQDP